MNIKINNSYGRNFDIGFGALIFVFIVAVAIVGVRFDSAVASPSYYDEGFRISMPLSLNDIKNVAESKIEWDAETPDGTSVTIETVVTESDTELPTIWQIATNGGSIPGIEPGADLSGKFFWTKQILETDDPDITPQLHSLTETIRMEARTEGYRISPEFDISGSDTAKDSRIFWQADERFDGNINVKVNVFTEGEWAYEQEVVNGGQIPGLGPGTDLSGAKIQTKTSFVGGPDFYPSLENIKIFLELE